MERTPETAVIDPGALDALVAALRSGGFRVLGPTDREGTIVYDDLESATELPIGWTPHRARSPPARSSAAEPAVISEAHGTGRAAACVDAQRRHRVGARPGNDVLRTSSTGIGEDGGMATLIWLIVWLVRGTPNLEWFGTWNDWAVALLGCVIFDVFSGSEAGRRAGR